MTDRDPLRINMQKTADDIGALLANRDRWQSRAETAEAAYESAAAERDRLSVELDIAIRPGAVEWTRDDEAHHEIAQELRLRVTVAEAVIARVRGLAAQWERMVGVAPLSPDVDNDEAVLVLRRCQEHLTAALDGAAAEAGQ